MAQSKKTSVRFMKKDLNRVSPFLVPMMITNMPAAYVAIRFGAKGPNMAVVTACALHQ